MPERHRIPVSFQDAAEPGAWLAEHHDGATELWVRIFKAGSGKPSATWADCVVERVLEQI